MLAILRVLWHVGNTVPNLANRSTTPVETQVRYERHLCNANVGEIWLGRLLNGNDAGRVVLLRRIAKQWLSAKDAEWVLYGAEAYSQVRNPALVKLLGLLAQDDELVSVSEHLEGVRLGDLQRIVFDEGVPIPATVAVRIILDAARATWKAHSLAAEVGLFPTERLFLPEGVLITSYGATLLSEVGVLAALARCAVPRKVPGLLAQLAPEEVGAASSPVGSPEVFSLGVLLWELLANSWLFSRRSDTHTHQELRLLEIPSLDRIERFGMPVPETIVQLVRTATERDPSRRYASVNEFIAALERLPAHFVASENQVAEVLRQRAHALLSDSRGMELERGQSGTFAEVRTAHPSVAPASASSHDWDRPTFAQSSLVSSAPPFVDSVTSIAKTHVPTAPALPTEATRTPPPRRRRIGFFSLSLTMLVVGIFVITYRGIPEPLRPAFLPAPAARVIPERPNKIPTPELAAERLPTALAQPDTSAAAIASETDPLAPPAPTDPGASSEALEDDSATAEAPPSTVTSTSPVKATGNTARQTGRRARPPRSSKAGREGNAHHPSLDPQWGI